MDCVGGSVGLFFVFGILFCAFVFLFSAFSDPSGWVSRTYWFIRRGQHIIPRVTSARTVLYAAIDLANALCFNETSMALVTDMLNLFATLFLYFDSLVTIVW